jgi:hypothetical protein
MSAAGFTVIVNTSTAPIQFTPLWVNDGVTVMVAMIGEVPEFRATNEEIEPEPDAPNPILGFELVHV